VLVPVLIEPLPKALHGVLMPLPECDIVGNCPGWASMEVYWHKPLLFAKVLQQNIQKQDILQCG
jgi:hypothetical protein